MAVGQKLKALEVAVSNRVIVLNGWNIRRLKFSRLQIVNSQQYGMAFAKCLKYGPGIQVPLLLHVVSSQFRPDCFTGPNYFERGIKLLSK